MDTRDNKIGIAYTPNKKIFNINLSYGLSDSKSENFRTKRHNLNITSLAKLSEQINLTQGFNLSKESDKQTSQINTGLKYNVGKLSSGIDLAQNRTKEKGSITTQTQNIQSNLIYGVNILKRTVPVSLSYGYNLLGVEKVKSDTFGFSFSLPVTKQIGVGYSHSQSSSPQAHTKKDTVDFNFTLQGKEKPYSLNTKVNLIKEDKITNNLSMNYSYPLSKQMSLTSSLNYLKKESTSPTYNFQTGIGYSF